MPENQNTGFDAFAKRVRKTLWAEGTGNQHDLYKEWETQVITLRAKKKYSKSQAVVQASKDYPILHSLFQQYDISHVDPEPDSHPDIKQFNDKDSPKIKCEGTEKTHRENLSWALGAAGEFRRTGVEPVSCPNDSAYYLYKMATENPKEFLAKVTQIEAKLGDEGGTRRQEGQRSIEEIDMMLATLEDIDEDEEEGEEAPCRMDMQRK